jgi:Tfp pilus assembly protein PilO
MIEIQTAFFIVIILGAILIAFGYYFAEKLERMYELNYQLRKENDELKCTLDRKVENQ